MTHPVHHVVQAVQIGAAPQLRHAVAAPLGRIVVLFLLGAILLFCVRKMFGQAGLGRPVPQVRRVPLMTPAERRVMGYIEQILPQARIHAQVSMGAIMQPRHGLNAREAMIARSRFASKRFDFLVEHRESGDIVAIIELDDRTHNRRNDAWRDRLTASVGYRTIRLPARERQTLETVHQHLLAAFSTPKPPA